MIIFHILYLKLRDSSLSYSRVTLLEKQQSEYDLMPNLILLFSDSVFPVYCAKICFFPCSISCQLSPSAERLVYEMFKKSKDWSHSSCLNTSCFAGILTWLKEVHPKWAFSQGNPLGTLGRCLSHPLGG